MAQDKPPQDLMHYEAMAQDALRGVVKAALRKAAAPGGLPGEHHFYITFKTQAPGVSGPPEVLSKYPDEMTIILQHQYWDLAPGETFFTVTLKFGGQPKRLSIPYTAVVRFFDPWVQFGLQFEAADLEASTLVETEDAATDEPLADDAAPAVEPAAKVVSLDQFRKK
ncbi:MAG: ClpXP protease specificity-enhancing factor SspB [Caulobacter sp.]|nr:ClpXP protease specificity-enhancing factor SspB [Caulobacter sp.]